MNAAQRIDVGFFYIRDDKQLSYPSFPTTTTPASSRPLDLLSQPRGLRVPGAARATRPFRHIALIIRPTALEYESSRHCCLAHLVTTTLPG
jgi:hypothetical protein